MTKIKTLLIAAIAGIVALPLIADTIELANGDLLEGKFVGSSNGIIMFDTGDGIEAFQKAEVVGLFLSDGVATAEAEIAETVAAPQVTTVTVPAGTRLVLRTTDTIDTRQHGAGHRFRAQLEGALVINGVTVAARGTFIHGRIAQSKQSGNMTGSSSMTIEFTDIMIDDQLYPIATGEIKAQGQNETGRTVKRTARSAAVGGLINGSKGARNGAKVGVGVSIVTGGSSINIPRGTILETALRIPLTVEQ